MAMGSCTLDDKNTEGEAFFFLFFSFFFFLFARLQCMCSLHAAINGFVLNIMMSFVTVIFIFPRLGFFCFLFYWPVFVAQLVWCLHVFFYIIIIFLISFSVFGFRFFVTRLFSLLIAI
ncbi:hypothetical protein DFH27DRAFT_293397 [Peziza echinospora]|nr:hypothetical protein DFH27DRAFT_293397 [Peziza echinospora]